MTEAIEKRISEIQNEQFTLQREKVMADGVFEKTSVKHDPAGFMWWTDTLIGYGVGYRLIFDHTAQDGKRYRKWVTVGFSAGVKDWFELKPKPVK